MWLGVIAIAIAAQSSPALAKTTYLTCTSDSDKSNVWKVSLNEEGRSAQISVVKSGYSENDTAIFSQEEVSFNFNGSVVIISRINLSIKATQAIGSRIFPIYAGNCVIASPVDREF